MKLTAKGIVLRMSITIFLRYLPSNTIYRYQHATAQDVSLSCSNYDDNHDDDDDHDDHGAHGDDHDNDDDDNMGGILRRWDNVQC